MDTLNVKQVRRMLLAFALLNLASLGKGARFGTDRTGYLSWMANGHMTFARGETSPVLIGIVLAVVVIVSAVVLAWREDHRS